MEDRIFDFMEKMYADLKNEIRTVGNQVAKLELVIENEIKQDIKASLDGYKQIAEGQEDLKVQISNIESKFENHDIQIVALKGGKQATR